MPMVSQNALHNKCDVWLLLQKLWRPSKKRDRDFGYIRWFLVVFFEVYRFFQQQQHIQFTNCKWSISWIKKLFIWSPQWFKNKYRPNLGCQLIYTLVGLSTRFSIYYMHALFTDFFMTKWDKVFYSWYFSMPNHKHYSMMHRVLLIPLSHSSNYWLKGWYLERLSRYKERIMCA